MRGRDGEKQGIKGLRGFTLVEVLFAIIILLIGVIAAMKIFPPGFAAFTESQNSNKALALTNSLVTQFKEHPETLPDAFLPDDWSSTNAQAAAGSFSFTDISPVDFQLTGTVSNQPYQWYLGAGMSLPSLDAASPSWPMWEPLSVRIVRHVVGEKVVIPSQINGTLVATATETGNWSDATQTGTVIVQSRSLQYANQWNGYKLYADDPGAYLVVQSVSAPINGIAVLTYAPVASGALIVNTGSALRQAAAGGPAYVPRFAPMTMPGQWDQNPQSPTYGTYLWGQEPVSIYDLRYRKVTSQELSDLADHPNNLPDRLYYTADYQAGTLTLLSDTNDRHVRFAFYVSNGTTLEQVPPVQGGTDLPPAGSAITFTAADGTTIPAMAAPDPNDATKYVLTFTAPWTLVAGSEQLNRAYIFVPIPPGTDPLTVTSTLASGQYTADVTTDTSTGAERATVLWFSPSDAGRNVKIDYSVLDWNILHDDVAVDSDGYVTLSVADPKLANVPVYPMEPSTWGLYGPMQDDAENTVLGFTHLRTGTSYDLDTTTPSASNPLYYVRYQQTALTQNLPGVVTAVDVSDAKNGRLRVGGLPTGTQFSGTWTLGASYTVGDVVFHDPNTTPPLTGVLPRYFTCITAHTAAAENRPDSGAGWQADWTVLQPDWTALQGETFRVFYRGQRDWTLQVYRAPAQFWFQAVDAGQTSTNMQAMTLGWDTFGCRINSATPSDRQLLALPGVYEGQSVAVDYQTRQNPSDETSPLIPISGETHIIPQRGQPTTANQGNVLPSSLVSLDQPPAKGSIITVRGISLTARALWVQPRSTTAYQYLTAAGTPPTGSETNRALRERWQDKSVMIVLPVVKE